MKGKKAIVSQMQVLSWKTDANYEKPVRKDGALAETRIGFLRNKRYR
jgi:hypothetical protein